MPYRTWKCVVTYGYKSRDVLLFFLPFCPLYSYPLRYMNCYVNVCARVYGGRSVVRMLYKRKTRIVRYVDLMYGMMTYIINIELHIEYITTKNWHIRHRRCNDTGRQQQYHFMTFIWIYFRFLLFSIYFCCCCCYCCCRCYVLYCTCDEYNCFLKINHSNNPNDEQRMTKNVELYIMF